MRIVSLLASATEVICALDQGESLVGRSHECDNPAWVRSLPPCSEPAFDISASSGEIDREVKRRLRAGEPLYRIHTDRIRELEPDLIVTQSHCGVCAVTPDDVERSGACIPEARLLNLSASSVEEIFSTYVEIGTALGVECRAHELVDRERARLHELRARTESFRSPSVLVLEWTDPVFPMGNWGPELIHAANGRLELGSQGQHSFSIPAGQVTAVDPEYLIIAPCGFGLCRSANELPILAANPWWNELRAVRDGKVAFADGNLYFNRSGTTVVRTAEILAEILHGTVTRARTEGQCWLWMRDVCPAKIST